MSASEFTPDHSVQSRMASGSVTKPNLLSQWAISQATLQVPSSSVSASVRDRDGAGELPAFYEGGMVPAPNVCPFMLKITLSGDLDATSRHVYSHVEKEYCMVDDKPATPITSDYSFGWTKVMKSLAKSGTTGSWSTAVLDMGEVSENHIVKVYAVLFKVGSTPHFVIYADPDKSEFEAPAAIADGNQNDAAVVGAVLVGTVVMRKDPIDGTLVPEVESQDLDTTFCLTTKGGGSDDNFHFGSLSITSASGGSGLVAKLSGGAVQIGGYTYFVDDETTGVSVVSSGYAFLCVKMTLSSGSGTFAVYSGSTLSIAKAALRAAQDDMQYYVFPLYLIKDGTMTIDYRPLANAGCWETSTSSSSSSGSSSGTS